MNSTIALWVNEEKSMGPTINGREVEYVPKPPWKLLQDRHFRLRLWHGAPRRHIVPKMVNIVRLTIAKAFLKGDACLSCARWSGQRRCV